MTYYSIEELAEVLRVSVPTLSRYRMTGEGPPYVKFGRNIRYPKAAVDDWINGLTRHSTSDQKGGCEYE